MPGGWRTGRCRKTKRIRLFWINARVRAITLRNSWICPLTGVRLPFLARNVFSGVAAAFASIESFSDAPHDPSGRSALGSEEHALRNGARILQYGLNHPSTPV